jgi:4-hydroxybenzoate polyprenyltransferase/phosphoserine phosphatase
MKKILVVDLDETLINSDMLFETFWSAFSFDWKIPIKSVGWLLKGKGQLKHNLANSSDINVKNLPYNKNVINYIKRHRKKGGYTALVTASNQVVADKIAKYLNLFDEIKGSSKKLNLKGNTKNFFLITRFGVKNYDYMGDSINDLPIWKNANKAITVNANSDIIKACKKINSNCLHLKPELSQNTFLNYIKVIRAYQWIKNILVFVPMLAAHQLTTQNFIDGTLAFIAFCLISSSVYVINDLLDLNADREHPNKKSRPFASGIIPIKNGLIIFLLLFVPGITMSFFIEFYFFSLMLIYFILTSLYSIVLKKIIILDICILGILYTLRIVGGGFATEIQISVWLFAFSIFLFLSLAAVKRQSELVGLKKRKKIKILGRNYQVRDLPIISMTAISAGFISVLIAGLYINTPDMLVLYSKPWTLGAASVVLLFWLMNIISASSRGVVDDDPIIYAIKDNTSRICLITVMLLMIPNFLK